MANLRTDNLCGRGFVSLNDGTVWSNFISGSTLSGYPATNGFNGNPNNDVYPAAGGTIVWTAPNGGISGSKIEVRVYAGNTHPIVRVNGKSTGAIVGSSTPDQRGAWVDVTEITGGILKTITCIGETISSVARQSGFGAVRIDGEILVDGLVGSKGGRSGIDGSVYFGERYSYLQLDGSSDFAFGTTDFTIEAWIKIDDDTNTNAIYDSRPSGSNGAQIALFYSGSGNAIMFAHGGTVRITGTKDVGADHSWHHIALTRASGSTKLFVDGVQDGSTYSDSTSYLNPANRPLIGQSGGSTNLDATTFFRGYISNLRVCAGHAVYTANFTPPTSPLTVHHIADDDKTVLLCCQDSDNPLQEATGKTITGFGRYYADTGELFTDTGFNATTGWTGTGAGGWTTTGNGVATHAQGTAGNLTQSISNLVVGQTYKLEVDVVTSDNDVAYFTIEELSPASRALGDATNAYVGHYEHYFQATATTHTVGFRGSSLFNGTITNLKLQSYGIGLTPKMPKHVPPFGIDAGNTFGGAISMNSSSWMYFPTGTTSERGGTRGLMAGGFSPGAGNTINFVTIQSDGSNLDFGDISVPGGYGAGMGSRTRGVIALGFQSTPSEASINVIDFVTIATEGNAQDFGDTIVTTYGRASASNSIRGIIAGGEAADNSIEYITIPTLGNGTDFGDLTDGRREPQATADPTRAVIAGGYDSPSTGSKVDTIDYIQIATTGNASDFGNLTSSYWKPAAFADHTRGVFAGGQTPSYLNIISFVTIQTTGDATDFGDLTITSGRGSGASDSTRGVIFTGLSDTGTHTTNVDVVTIQSTGNATKWGNTTVDVHSTAGLSNGHGGLG